VASILKGTQGGWRSFQGSS